ncbi:TOMM precursor leader peptide-binding protein [Nonomuraea sp. NPDC050404]|uniref:TOMM precursor leader peptide-binding protein n=1 Tax=Nonomuraea sp. NPDC050404 TaxID=3155783 RepID=UPI0033D83A6F
MGVRDALGDDLGEPKAAQAELPIHLAGRWALVGPRTAASGQPCGRCLGRRWQALRPNEERHILERRHGPMRMIGPLPYLTDFAVDVLTELCEQATNDVTPIRPGRGKVYQLALDTLEIRTYTLIADPTCPVCCTPRADTAPGAVPTLATQPKPSPGAYRLRSPLNYDIDIDAYANPVCGALGFGAFPAYESSTTAPVTGALRMRGPFDFHEFFWSGHANRFDASGVLGVMEGLERYAGLWPRDLRDQEIGTYADFKDMALDPRACGLYSDEYYATSTVHVPFREDAMLRWIWGYSLRDERPILVAEQQAYYGRGILGGERDFVMECSNGCAGGGSVEEATLHGMLELIERDAFLLCWYGKQPLPEIDPYTCADPEIKIMVDRLAADGYEMRFFDNRIDLPIPVVTGVAVKKDGGLGTLCYAAGAGLDPEDAVRAALCEIASYVPGFDERVEDKLAEAKALSADYHMVKELRHHALLHGLPEMVRHSDFLLAGERTKQSMDTVYGDWQRARPRNRDLLQDLVFVKDILVDNGFDVIIVDQTSPEQRAESLHTICVIAPGLLPIDFGWTRQRALHLPRTRTALRRAGLRPRVLDRADLHAVPHPFP